MLLDMNVKIKTIKCPMCGEELIVIDNTNYFTSICPKCFSTIFEEFDGKLHVNKNGFMKDGYNASLDIFIKQIVSNQLVIKNNIADEDLLLQMFLGVGIYDKRILDHFSPLASNFELRNPCMYFDGYEIYLKMMNEVCKEMKFTV